MRSLGASWPALIEAQEKTDELRSRLSDALADIGDPNCAVVVTGSLGRGEASEESDADWLLLLDSPSDPAHAQMARRVGEAVRAAGFKDVGPTRTFGGIVVSHTLVHYIAGTSDTNENLTRRMLLLAESHALTGSVVRGRVIRNVLARYVEHDRSVRERHRVPHFLLNDVVRYWRTMASDYASKMWERDKEGWATRNIKLRFSRKLLFASGLIASFAGNLFPSEALEAAEPDDFYRLLADLIRQQTDFIPLDLLAKVALHESVDEQTSQDLFGSYDTFLRVLGDKRKHLDALAFDAAAADPVYDELRHVSRTFRIAMNRLFFDEHPKLGPLIRQYGVF